MAEPQQSGQKQTFRTGAQRDSHEGKPRPDLISPLFALRLGELLRHGGEYYGDWNWAKGMPQSRYLASAERHLAQYKASLLGLLPDDGEDHASQAAFNLMCMIHNEECIRRGLLPPELDDMADLGPRDRVPTLPRGENLLCGCVFDPNKYPIKERACVVYLSGPFSDGGKADHWTRKANIANACRVADKIVAAGHYVHIPHTATEPLDNHPNTDYAHFLALDAIVIRGLHLACAARGVEFVGFRMEGSSVGGDWECDLIRFLGRRVEYHVDSIRGD